MKIKPKILVVDDEPLIQTMTKSALRRVQFQGQELELIPALSAEEGRKLYEEHPDISVILLDVVMEYETAGLDFSKWVRENHHVEDPPIILRTGQSDRQHYEQPIILRTGQAGQFMRPVEILKDFPVNDYREKIELANPKSLQNVLVSALITHALHESCRHLSPDDPRPGWQVLIELGEECGSYHLAEPLDKGLQEKWPLPILAASILAPFINAIRRLRSPVSDKIYEFETKPAPLLIVEVDGAIQFLSSYQADHPRRAVVEADSRRVDQPHLDQLKSQGWDVQPWWALKPASASHGDYSVWCVLKKV